MGKDVAVSWGRLPGESGSLTSNLSTFAHGNNVLPRGMGRSYGDVCTNAGGTLVSTALLNKFLAFDPDSGLLTCESGVTISDIQHTFISRGWMSPVTPGTQFVSIGGAIANDVHGKNHHVMGTFGHHVVSLVLMRTSGEVLTCSPSENADLFRATIGGLGLTGLILQATIQLKRVPGPWLDAENVVFSGISDFLAISDASESTWDYSVAWIDCSRSTKTRGIFMRGNSADHPERTLPKERQITFPINPPFSLVNKLSTRVISSGYYTLNRRKPEQQVVHYQPFFYPLDGIRQWSRMYGNKGFYQHQSVIPRTTGETVLNEMLTCIQRSGQGSFLSVLKTFGNRESLGMLSFARSGITLALDFPNLGARTLSLLDSLDEIVMAAGGAINPSKDARMSRETFEASFPQLEEFTQYRDAGISSGLSRRLLGS